MKKLLLASLLLITSLAQASISDVLHKHSISNDIYVVDRDKKGFASLETVLTGRDQALVLIHRPTLRDIIKKTPYSELSYILLSNANILEKHDSNADSFVDSQDIAYSNLGLLSVDKKTNEIHITALKDTHLAIKLHNRGLDNVLSGYLIDGKEKYPIFHVIRALDL